MSLLSYYELQVLQQTGVIVNSLPEHVNQSSIDITLGPEILCECMGHWRDNPVVLRNRTPLTMVRKPLPYILDPGEFILAGSAQIFNLPNWMSAEYKLKSSMARMGLNHLNAGWADPGWNGSVLTLELVNATRYHSIVLNEGDRIGQMIFFKHETVPLEASYATKGSYNGDTKVEGVKSK